MKTQHALRPTATAPAMDELERELAGDAMYGSSGYFVRTDVRAGSDFAVYCPPGMHPGTDSKGNANCVDD